ncbi:uncharacterized protein LOC142985012 [Anticarsia gemmatalis]|uniref:uncharacterized protein LOC142985012 n=1 Tax=Anticarsia gemmatalis TaxID=129554 RepID=UPI003F7580A7
MSLSSDNAITFVKVQKSPEEKYKKCGLLNIIQHIDIYGKHRSVYNEYKTKLYRSEQAAITSISSNSSKRVDCTEVDSGTTVKNAESKLSRFSVTTKVCGLYPGHDILSKRARYNKQSTTKPIIGCYVPR